MFAYYFPPHGGGGVQRTAKFVKYLPEHGFRSVVVAGSPRAYPLVDRVLERDIPAGTVVARARALPLRQAQWKLDGALRRAGLSSTYLSELLWPDAFVGWLPLAVWHGLRAARRYRPRVIYSSSSPVTCHLAALVVHQLTGLPWVADFRDSWTRNPEPPFRSRRWMAASAQLERQMLAEASRICVVDDTIELLGVGSDDPRRVVISNGVDPDDLPPAAQPAAAGSERDVFRLSHVGSLYGSRDAGPVFGALSELIGDGVIDPRRFELRVVGHASLRTGDFGRVPVTLSGYVDHETAVQEMVGSTALLFYQPPGWPGTSGKIYEYLAAGRPVLAVADPQNLGCRLVEELDAGECADAGDAHSIRSAIERLFRAWEDGQLAADPTVRARAMERFSRRQLTARLAKALTEASEATT